jgi:hypothetical protein
VEQAIGGTDRDHTDTIAVDVRESDEEEKVIIDGNPLEALSSIILGQLGS